jgi:hypothetical protein
MTNEQISTTILLTIMVIALALVLITGWCLHRKKYLHRKEKSKRREKLQINWKWLSFWFNWDFTLTYSLCGYFDPRHRIDIGIIFFHLTLILPFKSKYTDECVPPEWGIRIHNNALWFYLGGKGNFKGGTKTKALYFPWDWTRVRTSYLKKGLIDADGFFKNPNPPHNADHVLNAKNWWHEFRGTNLKFWEDEWKAKFWSEEHEYTYVLRNKEVQKVTATIRIKEREWRWKWLTLVPFPNRVRRQIAVEFSDEVGERAGSWKGGCTGCSQKLLPGETPLECLRRMEREVKFN